MKQLSRVLFIAITFLGTAAWLGYTNSGPAYLACILTWLIDGTIVFVWWSLGSESRSSYTRPDTSLTDSLTDEQLAVAIDYLTEGDPVNGHLDVSATSSRA
jgi:hypothetical protein